MGIKGTNPEIDWKYKKGGKPLRDTQHVEKTGQKGKTKGITLQRQVRESVPTPHYQIPRKTK